MKYIAHRGLFNGPDRELENSPDQIDQALALGYDCEIDLWVVNNELYLGHDGPKYKITTEYLNNDKFWIHAKNLEALTWLRYSQLLLQYFWHESDKFTLTSNNYIWTNPGNELGTNSIMVMPCHVDTTLEVTRNVKCYAICSDYIIQIREMRCD